MGDINIVTQPTSDVPPIVNTDTIQTSPANPSPTQPSTANPDPAKQLLNTLYGMSTVEQMGQQNTALPGGVASGVLELYTQQKELLNQQAEQIKQLKEQNAKLAMNVAVDDTNDTLEEALASFFGYND